MNSGLQITILNLVKKLQQRDEENFKALGKSFGMEIQKGIQKTTSRNGYIKMNLHCSKTDFDSINRKIDTKIKNEKLQQGYSLEDLFCGGVEEVYTYSF